MHILKWIFALSIILLTACSNNQTPTLRLGTNVWPGYEPLYLAREKEYLDAKKVRLVEYSNSSQVIQSFHNGLIDAAALTLDEALLLLESGAQIRIILVMDISAGADAIVGQSNIQTFKDIRGKNIGVEGNALGAYMLTRAIEIAGIDKNSVNVIQLSVDQHEKAFRQKQVDAVVTFEPVSSKLLTTGGKLLFSSRQIPGEIVDVMVVHKEYLRQHPENIDYLISAWYKALDYINKEPEASAIILGNRMQLDSRQTLKSYEGLTLPDANENQRLIGNQPQLLTSANRLSRLMFEQGLLDKEIDASAQFSDKLHNLNTR